MSYSWVTIASFTLPTDMHIARSKLESEGIACEVQDELTVQSHNFYSNAIGGVKLKVRDHDLDRARKILIEMEVIVQEEKKELGGFLKFTNRFTGKIPLLNKLILEIRIVVVFSLLIAILGFILLLIE
ncbi:MAG: DUF2007 domain-containing protein [Crocinitomicaceae bacterium]